MRYDKFCKLKGLHNRPTRTEKLSQLTTICEPAGSPVFT